MNLICPRAGEPFILFGQFARSLHIVNKRECEENGERQTNGAKRRYLHASGGKPRHIDPARSYQNRERPRVRRGRVGATFRIQSHLHRMALTRDSYFMPRCYVTWDVVSRYVTDILHAGSHDSSLSRIYVDTRY